MEKLNHLELYDIKGNGAIFGEDRSYRYALYRIWDPTLTTIMFIGLNPSTANETEDDPTIRRVKRFAKDNGYGSVMMVNLFAYVTAYPEELKKCADPVGKFNDQFLKDLGKTCSEIVFAWGSFPEAKDRAKEVIKLFPDGVCLLQNRDGSPRHPLYVPADTKLKKFIGPYGVCKVCGCVDNNACNHPEHGNCFWIDDDHDLCSHCYIPEWREEEKTIHRILDKYKTTKEE